MFYKTGMINIRNKSIIGFSGLHTTERGGDGSMTLTVTVLVQLPNLKIGLTKKNSPLMVNILYIKNIDIQTTA